MRIIRVPTLDSCFTINYMQYHFCECCIGLHAYFLVFTFGNFVAPLTQICTEVKAEEPEELGKGKRKVRSTAKKLELRNNRSITEFIKKPSGRKRKLKEKSKEAEEVQFSLEDLEALK